MTNLWLRDSLLVKIDELEYFDRDDFGCKCGHELCPVFPEDPAKMKRLLWTIDHFVRARYECGFPFEFTSFFRCQYHPIEAAKIADGRGGGSHFECYAGDLLLDYEQKKVFRAVWAELTHGNCGLGSYPWGCHADRGHPRVNRPAYWSVL